MSEGLTFELYIKESNHVAHIPIKSISPNMVSGEVSLNEISSRIHRLHIPGELPEMYLLTYLRAGHLND